jgi:cyclophilin family peptidyl-prolyl cis-trans isomerase
MVKKGKRKHSNESQFYITLGPLASFDNLFVCFGRVIQGFRSIKRIEEVETSLQRPIMKVEIRKCGEYSV